MTAWQRALADFDTAAAERLWSECMPHMQPPSDVTTALHMARTAAESVPIAKRQYSHRWLVERGLPSQLPPEDRPQVVDGVGISCNSQYPVVADAIRGAMEYAVLDCYANGDKEPEIVKPRMAEARARERKGLGLG